jgi:hypothetical protein
VAERVKSALIAAFSPRDCFISLASGVIGTIPGGVPGRCSTRWRTVRRSACRGGPVAEVKRGLPPAVRWAVEAVSDRKGADLLVLDLRRVNDATDFFVIASGTSDAHVRGLSDACSSGWLRTGIARTMSRGLREDAGC